VMHELKTHPEYWWAVNSQLKRFEIRKNDRDFHTGDVLKLEEFSPRDGYTGRSLLMQVVYITAFAQRPGYVVMGIEPVKR
jgi:hypothetical protein